MFFAALLSAQGGQERDLHQEAAKARDANRVDDAIRLYREAVDSEPSWIEGWWYLGTLLYDRDDYPAAASAFSRAAQLDNLSSSTIAPTLVMLGLSEAKTGAGESALKHLSEARKAGLPRKSPLYGPMLFALGSLWTAQGETRGGFDRAQEALDTLAREGVDSEDLTVALGLAVLRRKQPGLGGEDLVKAAGRAEALAAQHRVDYARQAYKDLAARYGSLPGVQFAYGKFSVSINEDDAAVAAFEAETKTAPSHLLAHLGLAGLLAGSQPRLAIHDAEISVSLAPNLPEAHYLLGLALFNVSRENADREALSRAITELETARNAAPGMAKTYFTLSRAYADAERPEDSKKAKMEFARLDQEMRDKTAR